MIFTKNKEGVRAIRAMKYKKCGWNIYSRTRTFGAEVHRSNIRVKRWHNNYENSELYWKTQLLLKWFAYQAQSYWNTDLWSRGTNFWDTLYMIELFVNCSGRHDSSHAQTTASKKRFYRMNKYLVALLISTVSVTFLLKMAFNGSRFVTIFP